MDLELCYQFYFSSIPPNWNGIGTLSAVPFHYEGRRVKKLHLSLIDIDSGEAKEFSHSHWMLELQSWNQHFSSIAKFQFRSRKCYFSSKGILELEFQFFQRVELFFQFRSKMAGIVELSIPELELFLHLAIFIVASKQKKIELHIQVRPCRRSWDINAVHAASICFPLCSIKKVIQYVNPSPNPPKKLLIHLLAKHIIDTEFTLLTIYHHRNRHRFRYSQHGVI